MWNKEENLQRATCDWLLINNLVDKKFQKFTTSEVCSRSALFPSGCFIHYYFLSLVSCWSSCHCCFQPLKGDKDWTETKTERRQIVNGDKYWTETKTEGRQILKGEKDWRDNCSLLQTRLNGSIWTHFLTLCLHCFHTYIIQYSIFKWLQNKNMMYLI